MKSSNYMIYLILAMLVSGFIGAYLKVSGNSGSTLLLTISIISFVGSLLFAIKLLVLKEN